MHTPVPAKDGALAGYVSRRRNPGSDQPLGKTGVQTAGYRILIAGCGEGAYLELSVGAVPRRIPRRDDTNTQARNDCIVRMQSSYLVSGPQQDTQPTRTIVNPIRVDDHIGRKVQALGDPGQDVGLDRAAAAQDRAANESRPGPRRIRTRPASHSCTTSSPFGTPPAASQA